AAACASYWAAMNGPQPGGAELFAPYQRSILFNRRLLHPAGQPPGSWQWENFYYTGAIPGAPTRTQRRQQDALGGTTVLRLIQDLRTIPPSQRGSTFRPTGRTNLAPIPLPIYPQAL
ncbi:MAG: hypothetical protein ICV87_11745, partial [Gemmatimonadetes bacterium]|nr:hypothetical protein [Gemmatimonadota bacterium]